VLCQLSYALHKHSIYMLRISKSTCVYQQIVAIHLRMKQQVPIGAIRTGKMPVLLIERGHLSAFVPD
jgi:hypothetical protein